MRQRRIVSPILVGLTLLVCPALGWVLVSERSVVLGAVLGLVVVVVALLGYDKWVLPLVLVAFFWAGLDLPLKGLWQAGRWGMLVLASGIGVSIWRWKGVHLRFRLFDLMALLTVVAILLSSLVSVNPAMTLLKGLALSALFLYGSIGARVAFRGHERVTIRALLFACEAAVYVSAVAYGVLGYPLFGNPNSLGAVMGVVVWPVLMWGLLVTKPGTKQWRRGFALVLCGILLYHSLARAGLLAAAVSGALVLVTLRQYKLLIINAMLITVGMAMPYLFSPAQWQRLMFGTVTTVVYKGHPTTPVLGSRTSLWTESLDIIGEHPWFGTGFGARSGLSEEWTVSFSTNGLDQERGSSFLALLEGVGLIGCLPFATLVALLLGRIWLVLKNVGQRRNPRELSVPLAGVLIGGLCHTIFESWLLAAGYYLCVLFWVFAFFFFDLEDNPMRLSQRGEQVQLAIPASSKAFPFTR